MTLVIDITDGHDLSNEARHEFLPKKSYICRLFHSTRHLTSCTLLTRQFFGVRHAGCKAYKRRLAYSVTVRISAQNYFHQVLSLKYWKYKAEELNLYALLYVP